MKKKSKNKQKYNNENKDNISELLVPGLIKQKQSRDSFFIFVFPTLYFLSQLSGIYLNGLRTNIKIKKKRKINLLTLWPCWVIELQRWKKGRGPERGREEEEEGESQRGRRSVRR